MSAVQSALTIMHEDINVEVLQLGKESSGVEISFGLFLGQDLDNRVTKPQNRVIKMSLFRFIAATKVQREGCELSRGFYL